MKKTVYLSGSDQAKGWQNISFKVKQIIWSALLILCFFLFAWYCTNFQYHMYIQNMIYNAFHGLGISEAVFTITGFIGLEALLYFLFTNEVFGIKNIMPKQILFCCIIICIRLYALVHSMLTTKMVIEVTEIILSYLSLFILTQIVLQGFFTIMFYWKRLHVRETIRNFLQSDGQYQQKLHFAKLPILAVLFWSLYQYCKRFDFYLEPQSILHNGVLSVMPVLVGFLCLEAMLYFVITKNVVNNKIFLLLQGLFFILVIGIRSYVVLFSIDAAAANDTVITAILNRIPSYILMQLLLQYGFSTLFIKRKSDCYSRRCLSN